MFEQGVGAGAVGVCPHSSQSGIAERYALRLLATLRCARRASWGFTKDRMGRAEALALVIKVLKLIGPIALSLLAGTAPDARAGTATHRDQPAVDFTRLRG